MSMEPVDIAANLEYPVEVEKWRFDELQRMFPDMPEGRAAELAAGADRCLLERARRLHADGCPLELAYRILR